MKRRHLTVLPAAVLTALLLAGCGGDQAGESSSLRVDPSASASLHVSDQPQSSVTNDAMEGGGAGGTNATNNDGHPEASRDHSAQSSGDTPLDDLGDAAGDLIEGAGDAAKDAGDAVGRAAEDAGDAVGRAAEDAGRAVR